MTLRLEACRDRAHGGSRPREIHGQHFGDAFNVGLVGKLLTQLTHGHEHQIDVAMGRTETIGDGGFGTLDFGGIERHSLDRLRPRIANHP
jgi:hypothetical protein